MPDRSRARKKPDVHRRVPGTARTRRARLVAIALLAVCGLVFSGVAGARPAHHRSRPNHHSHKQKHKRRRRARITGQQCAQRSDCAAIYDFASFSPAPPGVVPSDSGFTIESHAVFGLGPPVIVNCDDGFSEVRRLGVPDIPVDGSGHFSYSDETDYPNATPPGQFQTITGEGQLNGNAATGTHTYSYAEAIDSVTLRHCTGTVQWSAKVSYFNKKYQR